MPAGEAAVYVGRLTVDPCLLDTEVKMHTFIRAPAAGAYDIVAFDGVVGVGVYYHAVGHVALAYYTSA